MNSKLQDRFGVSLHVSFLPFVIQLLIHPHSAPATLSARKHLVIDTQNDSKTCKPKKIIAEHPTIFHPSQSQTLKKNKIIQEEETDFFLATLFAIFPTSLPGYWSWESPEESPAMSLPFCSPDISHLLWSQQVWAASLTPEPPRILGSWMWCKEFRALRNAVLTLVRFCQEISSKNPPGVLPKMVFLHVLVGGFFPPIWKICSSKWVKIFPKFSGWK